MRLILDSRDNEVGLERPAVEPFIDVALRTFGRLSDRYRMQALLRADDAYRVGVCHERFEWYRRP